MTNWRQSPAVAVIALALFAIIQLTVPISRFGNHEVTARFGWQMFAGAVPAPQFEVETADGTRTAFVDDYMAWPRADIDIIHYLPDHLCNAVPGAISVNWESGSKEC